jgi:outer membrane protein OmpA-like peptidoglycan-associated protein
MIAMQPRFALWRFPRNDCRIFAANRVNFALHPNVVTAILFQRASDCFVYLRGAAAVERRISKALRMVIGGAALAAGLIGATTAMAQGKPEVSGRIDWGVWIDPDGCMHYYSDGGLEGYMVERVNPTTGKPVCLKLNTCLVENTDTLFATDSAKLTPHGRQRLQNFFQGSDAFGFAVYGHTDSRASDEYNIGLSQRRAASVAAVARSVGGFVEREIGYGEREPVASNSTAAGMQQNRRVEVVCYRW